MDVGASSCNTPYDIISVPQHAYAVLHPCLNRTVDSRLAARRANVSEPLLQNYQDV